MEPPTGGQSSRKTHSESSPLLATDSNATDVENGSTRVEIPDATSSRPTDPTPSWSEAFAYVSPYLRPRDRHHALLAFVALLTVLLEKVRCDTPLRERIIQCCTTHLTLPIALFSSNQF